RSSPVSPDGPFCGSFPAPPSYGVDITSVGRGRWLPARKVDARLYPHIATEGKVGGGIKLGALCSYELCFLDPSESRKCDDQVGIHGRPRSALDELASPRDVGQKLFGISRP